MDEAELEEWVYFFTKVHGGCRFIYPDSMMAKHRYDLRYPPKGMAQVSDEYGNLEFLVYFNDERYPWWVED